MLRLSKLLQQRLKLLLAEREVGDGGVFINRAGGSARHVGCKTVQLRLLRAQALHQLLLRRHVLRGFRDGLLQAVVDEPVADVHLHEQVQQHPEHGQRHDEHDPCDLRHGVARPVDQPQNTEHRQHPARHIEHGRIPAEELRAPEQKHEFQHQQQRDDGEPAEHHVQNAALAALQQMDFLLVLKPFLPHGVPLSPQWIFHPIVYYAYPCILKHLRDKCQFHSENFFCCKHNNSCEASGLGVF